VVKRRRKRKSRYRDFRTDKPTDGLEINRSNESRHVSKRSTSFTMFDKDCYCIDTGKSFKQVSIASKVRHTNFAKSLRINGYKERINGRE
jgi:hypothetical protein